MSEKDFSENVESNANYMKVKKIALKEKSETLKSTLKISTDAVRKKYASVLVKNKGGDEIYGIFNLQGWYPSL